MKRHLAKAIHNFSSIAVIFCRLYNLDFFHRWSFRSVALLLHAGEDDPLHEDTLSEEKNGHGQNKRDQRAGLDQVGKPPVQGIELL